MSASAPQRFVSRLTRASGSNFYYSFLFLPRPQREAIHALYAFCREVDDSVDRSRDPEEAARRVDYWRGELEACYAGAPTHPITISLASHLARFPMRREDLALIIDGVAMDVIPGRYRSWDELLVYCHRVASAVGLACIEIFGYTDGSAREYAVALGQAFQLTNILRDVRSDAERGRVYLPQEDLDRFGCPEADLRADRPSAAFVALMSFEASRARELFARARRLFPSADRRTLFAAEIMARIYEAILARIERRGYDVLSARVGISRSRRLAIAASCYLRARRARAA